MGQVGIWRRRVSATSDDFVYGISGFQREYVSLDAAQQAFDKLVQESQNGTRDINKAYHRLVKAGEPLFQQTGKPSDKGVLRK